MIETLEQEIYHRLMDNKDEKYKEFHCKLMPTVDPDRVIGVRTPIVRKLAKEYAKRENIEEYLTSLPHKYYDADNLHGFILEGIRDYDKCIEEIDRLLPYIDNWATCDFISPKIFNKPENRKKLLKDIERWIHSDKVYTIRFAIKMLMCHYLDDDFDEKYLRMVADVKHEDYYVKMMVAWYFATALAKQYDSAVVYIEEKRLDDWTHKKAISKARESNRVSPEHKKYLKKYSSI